MTQQIGGALGLALLVALANAQVRGADAASLLASQARGIEWVTALSALLALFGAALACGCAVRNPRRCSRVAADPAQASPSSAPSSSARAWKARRARTRVAALAPEQRYLAGRQRRPQRHAAQPGLLARHRLRQDAGQSSAANHVDDGADRVRLQRHPRRHPCWRR